MHDKSFLASFTNFYIIIFANTKPLFFFFSAFSILMHAAHVESQSDGQTMA